MFVKLCVVCNIVVCMNGGEECYLSQFAIVKYECDKMKNQMTTLLFVVFEFVVYGNKRALNI